MANLENKFNSEEKLEAKIHSFCCSVLSDEKLKELEFKRLPFHLLGIICILVNIASIISNFVFFAKRNEWVFNYNINDIILYVFLSTIVIYIINYKAYSNFIKNQVILILFRYAGAFKFGKKSQVNFIINQLRPDLPSYLDCHCTDRFTGKYKNTSVDIIKFTLSRLKFIPHIFGKCFDGLLIRIPYNRKYGAVKKLLARREDGIDDITITVRDSYMCIIVSAPRKIWFTFSLLFPATNRTVYTNIIKEIVILQRIIDKFIPNEE
ncbi:hypothetical protein IJ182_09520 [bacterium]|nr:hypothetical protein [bacterium]